VTQEVLAKQFEEQRPHLRAVAYRLLGSACEADDAVQESWLRLSRSDVGEIANLRAWLTTVVSRVCLDMLRSRTSRREDALADDAAETLPQSAAPDPAHEAELTDSVGVALLVVLETLTPGERLAFVLHDVFALPFEEIAPIVGRSPVATRQLASRARRRVQGASPDGEADLERRREVVQAFLAASRNNDFGALLELLDPGVVLRADDAAVVAAAANAGRGAPALAPEIRGARAVATALSGTARAARPALIDGVPGAVWAVGGTPRAAFVFEVEGGRIVGIDILFEAADMAELDVEKWT
jgi:RNA polymerase sigma-70 factor (ECF subfamily)